MSDLQVALTNTAGITSIISFWIFVASNAFKNWKPKILSSAFFVLLIGFIALTCAIVARGIEAQRFPLSNLYESLLWFAWAIMGAYLWLAATLNHAGVWHLGWLASLTAASFFLYGSWLPQSQHDIQPLVPALVSYWRQIHVPPLIVSYAMFFLSGLSGLVQLWWAGRRVSVYGLIVTIVLACSAIALGTFSQIAVYYLQALFVGGSILGVIFSWLNLKKVKTAAIK
jgi:ABC-type transport system involved in cytochrome c biogenesis permease subunit